MIGFRRVVALGVALSVALLPVAHAVPQGVISTEQVAADWAQPAPDARGRLMATLDRSEVVSALQARGVDADAARARVASLTDAEAAQLVAQIDAAPAGGEVLGTIVFIFVLLLITDILGFTKVYPFTRSIR